VRCDETRALVSAAADGEIDDVERARLDDELARCPDCRAFADSVASLRTRLRFEIVSPSTDLTAAVLERLAAPAHAAPRRRRSLLAVAAAALVAGFAAGTVFVGVTREPDAPVAALDVGAAVLEAQHTVGGLSADVRITERGWHPDVPVRSYAGTLRYRSPETLVLQLHDRTDYPSAAWHANDVTRVADEATSWSRAWRACPREALPECLEPAPAARRVVNREPFPDATPLPLDLVVPVGTFARSAETPVLDRANVNGREAVQVGITVAQARPLLDGFLEAGTWRELHPTDSVDLWLDAAAMVPLRVTVTRAATTERAEWAAAKGYADRDGEPILSIDLTNVDLASNAVSDVAVTAPPAPSDGSRRDAGFHADARVAERLAPASLPPDMRLVRAGRVDAGGAVVDVAAWSDGRAFVKVRATDAWNEDRLFGQLGELVRAVELDGAGVGYVDERGARVGLHSDDLDVVVTGSLTERDLVRIASSLGVTGEAVPKSWPEASTRSVDELRSLVPHLLVPAGLDGFGPPAARIRGNAAMMTFAGPGSRGFTLVQVDADTVGPPLDDDVREVTVRGRPGRWSPSLGTLEWREDGVVSLSSTTLSLDELLAIASQLERA
jgi:hypothetical protein